MKKEEFLAELAQLLVDIPEEEKKEALAFYRSYFEDAGEENEENVLRELESPQKVAETIRTNFGPVKEGREESSIPQADLVVRPDMDKEERREEKTLKKSFLQNHPVAGGLLLLLLVAAFTGIWVPGLGGIAGVVAACFFGFFGIVIVFGVMAIAFLAGGAAIFIAGISLLVATLPVGLMLMGIGLLMVVLGIFCLMLEILICGKFVPWLFNSIKNLFAKKEVA